MLLSILYLKIYFLGFINPFNSEHCFDIQAIEIPNCLEVSEIESNS